MSTLSYVASRGCIVFQQRLENVRRFESPVRINLSAFEFAKHDFYFFHGQRGNRSQDFVHAVRVFFCGAHATRTIHPLRQHDDPREEMQFEFLVFARSDNVGAVLLRLRRNKFVSWVIDQAKRQRLHG